MFRKKVKCRNCGFLALSMSFLWGTLGRTLKIIERMQLLKDFELLGSQECIQRGRDKIANGTHPDLSVLICTRHVWSGSDFKDKSQEDALQLLNLDRKCAYFFPYNPGYPPIEHRELQREAKTQRLLIIGMLLAAAIGAVAAVVGQLIAQ